MIRSFLLAGAVLGGTGAAAAVPARQAETPLEFFVACPVSIGDPWAVIGEREPLVGGRILTLADGRRAELVGPVASTDQGAAAAAVDYGAAYGATCLAVPMWDIWKLGTPLEPEVGRYAPIPR